MHVAETSTDKIPNSSPTAASASSDLYGAAILDACTQLNARLAPVCEALGADATMEQIANEAWMRRIDLCSHGFYITPDVTGAHGDRPFGYFVYGAAVAEVEIDCLTGEWHNTRTDIVMDVGNPINPSIDIGQVEGGFVQVRAADGSLSNLIGIGLNTGARLSCAAMIPCHLQAAASQPNVINIQLACWLW